MTKFTSWMITALTISCFTQTKTLLAQEQTMDGGREYFRITVEEADIHVEPSQWSSVAVQAQKGDIFLSFGTSGEWYKVRIAESPIRYLHQSLTERAVEPKLQVSPEVRKNICVELEEARHQAAKERRRYKELQRRGVDRKFPFVEGYQLTVLRKYGISPALAEELNCESVLYRPPMSLYTVVFILMGIAPYVVVGGLMSAVTIWYRRATGKVVKSSGNRQVLWKTLVLGTLISTPLFVIAFTIINPRLPWVIGDPLTRISMAILGFSIVGCYLLALRIVHHLWPNQTGKIRE